MSDPANSETGMDIGVLTARVLITSEDPIGCPLADRECDNAKQSVTHSGNDEKPICQIAFSNGDISEYSRAPIDEGCPCGVFDEYDSIMTLESVDENRFVVSVVVPNYQVIRSVFEELRERGFSVSIEKIRPRTATDGALTETIPLTEKQQEALALAVETGYYDQPRKATLTDLADELGVSSSAVSQRLNAVERKLVNELASHVGSQTHSTSVI